MHRLKLVIAGIVAIAAIIVIAQNTASVETRLLFITITMPRALLLLLAVATGFVLGVLFSFPLGRGKGGKPPAA